ncbi:unnamed protein product [Urochloa humidicola]
MYEEATREYSSEVGPKAEELHNLLVGSAQNHSQYPHRLPSASPPLRAASASPRAARCIRGGVSPARRLSPPLPSHPRQPLIPFFLPPFTSAPFVYPSPFYPGGDGCASGAALRPRAIRRRLASTRYSFLPTMCW